MKTTQEMIVVMQAFADGKEIQYRVKSERIIKWIVTTNPNWDWQEYDYRIKPDPPVIQTIAYSSADEVLKAMEEHGPSVRYGTDGYQCTPFINSDLKIILVRSNWHEEVTLSKLHVAYTWIDGTPCGKTKQPTNSTNSGNLETEIPGSITM